MADEQVVLTDKVSEGTSPISEGGAPTPSAPEPLSEERIKHLIAEATEQGRIVGRRELQSQQDRNLAEAQRKARATEDELSVYKTSFGNLDEDTQKEVELARLKAKEKHYQATDQEEQQRQAQEVYAQQLHDSLISHLRELEIDVADKRIDWAADATDFISGRSRFDASVTKILKTNVEKALQRGKDELAKERKDQGLDSVITQTAGEAGSGKLTVEMVAKMSFDERFARRAEIAKLRME